MRIEAFCKCGGKVTIEGSNTWYVSHEHAKWLKAHENCVQLRRAYTLTMPTILKRNQSLEQVYDNPD